MAIRFSKLYTVGQNSRSNSTNFNGEMDNIYNSINTVDSDRSDLAGTGRTTETVKGNADALTAHKASSDHDTHNDALYYRQSAVDSKVSDLAGVGRTTQTVKGNSDALTTHKASSDHDTHTDAMYYRQTAVDSKDTTTLTSAKSYSDGNLTTHKSSSDHDTHNDGLYYRQSAVDTKVNDLAGAGRTTETIKGNYDALTTHKNSSDHDTHTDAMYYRQATVDSKINNASKTLTIAAGTAFPSAPYTDGQVFWRSDLNQQFSYSGAVGAWLPSVPGNTTSHGASLNGVWHFDADLYSTRGTVGTFTRASVANDPNTFASVASGLPRLTAGKYGKGVMIEEGTTNLVYNSDFETVTGTATVFSDPMTSSAAWTNQSGGAVSNFSFASGGATSTVNGAYMIAGNISWKPLTGSGGQNLALTAQATGLTPAAMPNGTNLLRVDLWKDSVNKYFAVIDETANQFKLFKNATVGGLVTLQTVSFTPTVSTTYTMTLSLDTTGLLTAKLYSGTGTGGALLQTLTATDTSLTGGFLLGVCGDTGVVVSAASVTAPWASGWSTGTLFSDPMTSGSAWTTQGGSFTYAAGGATSGAGSSVITAGNSAWKPLTGSGGQNLSLTKQATFTMPATVPTNIAALLYLWQDSGNRYYVHSNGSTLYLKKMVGGTTTTLASVAQALTASTAYTITLSLDTTGLLTAKLYSGTGTGGTLMQTLTATDTSLAGGFLIGVGGDTGVVISAASVTGPRADWAIGGDARVAWALTKTSPISGSYSARAVGVVGASGYISCTVPLSASTSYVLSGFANTQSVGAGGAKVSANVLGTALNSSSIAGTTSTTRYVVTGTSGTSGEQNIVLTLADAGTAVFDAIQLEAKAYATSYLRNDSTSASVTRNAETLTIPSSVLNASAGTISMWVYENGIPYGSAFGLDSNGSNRFLFYKHGAYQAWFNSDSANLLSVATPAIGWHLVTLKWNGTAISMYLDGALVSSKNLASPVTFAGVSNVYVGVSNAGGNQWNSVIDDIAVFNRALTDAEISALYQSPVMLNDLAETPNWPALTNKPTTVGGYGITDAVTTTQMGVANGVATLGADGKVPSAQITNPNWSAITNKPTTVSGYGITDVTTVVEEYIPLWTNDGSSGNVASTVTTSGSVWLSKNSTTPSNTLNYSGSKLHTLSTSWSSTIQGALEMVMWSSAGGTVNAAIWDYTTGAIVPGSTVTRANVDPGVVRGPKVALVPGRVYGVTMWNSTAVASSFCSANLVLFP